LAVALGLDVSCRIALACTLDRGWYRTAAIGVSAVLAQTGFTGARNIFNGRFGFLELYQPNGYDASVLLRDLGTAFRGEALSYKPYPCGRPLHAAIDAALAARAQLKLKRPDDIAWVTIEAEPAGHSDQFGRGPTKRRPTQVVEAQFALPYLVATALVHGKVGIAEVDDLGDASVLSLSDRIAGIARDERPRGMLSITVQRNDGRSITVETTDPIGSPEKPLTSVQLEAKFRRSERKAGSRARRE
jgi:2-methylcitrate dehydratase PrpD